MTKTEPWFLSERAEMLAQVAFTRHPGISLHSRTEDSGLDFLVSLPSKQGGRVFGVQVKGARRRETYVTPKLHLRAGLVEQVDQIAGDSPFPIGIAVFDMSDDAGYFGWLLAPTVSDSGIPSLEHRNRITVTPLTPEELGRIIAEVDHWYDSRAVRCPTNHA